TPADVVILPAFGVTVKDFERLRAVGCVLVDTTCGSVLNVWKRVDSYAKDGFTAVIHGKYYHEETKATSSQVTKYPAGRYLVVRDMEDARQVCVYIEEAGSAELFLRRFAGKMSPGFDPDRDLIRVGVANQTTMLSGESLAIAAELRKSMAKRYGEAALPEHFRTFDTICSATQDRQDAVLKLIADPLDLMVVIGGYNSSNTTHLAAICHDKAPTYHIEDASCIDPAAAPRVAAHPGRRERPDRRPDGLGQDVRGLPRRHRLTLASGPRGHAHPRHAGRVRFAAQGAVQRCPEEPGGAARRDPPHPRNLVPAGCGNPHAGANRRHAGRGAPGDGAAAAAHPRDHAGGALPHSHLGARPRA